MFCCALTFYKDKQSGEDFNKKLANFCFINELF